MKKLKKVLVVVFIVLIIGGVVSEMSESENIRGKWTVVDSGIVDENAEVGIMGGLKQILNFMVFSEGNELEFLKNGKVVFQGSGAGYEIIDNKLSITSGDGDMVYDLEMNDEKMILTDGNFKALLQKK